MFDIARCIEMVILLRNSLQYSDLSSDNHSDPRSFDIHLRNVLLHLHAQSGGLHSYTERRSGNNISGPRRRGQLPVQTVSQEARSNTQTIEYITEFHSRYFDCIQSFITNSLVSWTTCKLKLKYKLIKRLGSS